MVGEARVAARFRADIFFFSFFLLVFYFGLMVRRCHPKTTRSEISGNVMAESAWRKSQLVVDQHLWSHQ